MIILTNIEPRNANLIFSSWKYKAQHKWKIRQGMVNDGVDDEDDTAMKTLWDEAYKDREPNWKETDISQIQYSTILGHGDEEGDIRGYESEKEDAGGA